MEAEDEEEEDEDEDEDEECIFTSCDVMCSLSLTDGREDSSELDSAKDEVEHEHEREKEKAGRIQMTSTQPRCWCPPCTVAPLPRVVAITKLWANQ